MTDRTVQADHEEIRHLAARFADAVTRRDYSAFEALWAPSATWAIDPPVGLDLTAAPQVLAQGLQAGTEAVWRSFVQLVHHSVVDVDGDTATARTYLTELGLRLDGSHQTVNGWYDDELVRTADGWRFLARRFHFLVLSDETIPGRWFDVAASSAASA